jgi:hypothetical protein
MLFSIFMCVYNIFHAQCQSTETHLDAQINPHSEVMLVQTKTKEVEVRKPVWFLPRL